MVVSQQHTTKENKNIKIIISAGAIALIIVVIAFLLPIGSSKQHLNDNGYTQHDVRQVVAGVNNLSFSLYQQLSANSNNKNIFFSPYSIESALLIAYEGARGNTRNEMQRVLGVIDEGGTRRGFAHIYNIINGGSKEYELSTANALWIDKSYPILERYKRLANEYYGTNIENLDICHKPEDATNTINSWVAKRTHNKIRNIIPAGVLNCNTSLVITNAIYFKGKWKYEFDRKKTFKGDFWVSRNEKVKVEMMRLSFKKGKKINYGENKEIEWIELPYKGDNLSMIILLPKENDISIANNYLNAHAFNTLLENMSLTSVDEIEIPKFKFETSYGLSDILANLGMRDAFSLAADFSGMDGTKNLYISKVLHKAYIDVNEEGTEAAASTAVIIGVQAVLHRGVRFIANHPFVFVIVDKRTNAILFMGRVVDPRSSK